VFVIGGTARAAELSTTTMVPGSNLLWCNIVNVSTVAQTVRIRIYDSGGTVVQDSGNVVIPARSTLWASSNLSGHCRFTTVNAKTLFRASINIYQGGNVIESIPAQ
jgi:hypothetical protein